MVRPSTVSDYTELHKSYDVAMAVCYYDPYVTLILVHLGLFNSLFKYGIAGTSLIFHMLVYIQASLFL